MKQCGPHLADQLSLSMVSRMGTGAGITLSILHAMHPQGLPPTFRMLEMGNTQMYGPVEEFAALFDFLKVPEPTKSRMAQDYGSRAVPSGLGGHNLEIMPAAGVAYECVDYCDPTTIKADFNKDKLPHNLVGAFDLITNFGTSEHVADQMNFFRYVHDACKVDGIMVHMVPAFGYAGHCLFKYDPKFFVRLAVANAYEILFAGFSPGENGVTLDLECAGWHGVDRFTNKPFDSTLVEFILRKRTNASFQPPLDASLEPIELPSRLISARVFPPELTFPQPQPIFVPPPKPRPKRFPLARRAGELLLLSAKGDKDALQRIRKRIGV